MDKAPMHTPGPWRSTPWSASKAQIIARVNGKETLVTGYALPNDARLIAAAPDLLQVANKAFDFLGGVDDAAEIRAELLSAIAKATKP